MGTNIPTPIKGTHILFKENKKWLYKLSDGSVIERDKNKLRTPNAMMVVDGGDGDYITSLNGEHITIVSDKVEIGKPNLISHPDTICWMSKADYITLRKSTANFCANRASINIAIFKNKK